MQLVNCPNQLTATDVVRTVRKTRDLPYKHWIPGLVLLLVSGGVSLLGTAVKPADEIDWLSRLAQTGNSGAQLQTGLAYRDGRYGLPRDAEKAFYWLEQAAEHGNAYAEDAVGSLYASGTGTEQDLAQAMTWWKKAIQDGNPQARLHLSEALLRTGGVQQAEQLLLR